MLASEVKNVVKSMKLGLTGRDIEKLLAPFDVGADGTVDYLEFERRYRTREEGNQKPQKNSKYKLAKLRELMYHYLISPKDTFRFVSLLKITRLVRSRPSWLPDVHAV